MTGSAATYALANDAVTPHIFAAPYAVLCERLSDTRTYVQIDEVRACEIGGMPEDFGEGRKFLLTVGAGVRTRDSNIALVVSRDWRAFAVWHEMNGPPAVARATMHLVPWTGLGNRFQVVNASPGHAHLVCVNGGVARTHTPLQTRFRNGLTVADTVRGNPSMLYPLVSWDFESQLPKILGPLDEMGTIAPASDAFLEVVRRRVNAVAEACGPIAEVVGVDPRNYRALVSVRALRCMSPPQWVRADSIDALVATLSAHIPDTRQNLADKLKDYPEGVRVRVRAALAAWGIMKLCCMHESARPRILRRWGADDGTGMWV